MTVDGKDLLPDFEFADDDFVAPVEPQKDPVVDIEEESDVPAEKQEEKKEEPKSAPSAADPNLLAAYNYYLENGIIQPGEEEVKEVTLDVLQEKLSSSLDNRIEQAIDAIVDPLPDFGQALVSMALAKGKDLSVQDIEGLLLQVKPMTLTSADLDDQKKAMDFMVTTYQKEGHSEEDARDMAELLKDKGKLSETARRFFAKTETARAEQVKQKATESRTQMTQQRKSQEQFSKEFAQAIEQTGWRADQRDAVIDAFFSGAFRDKMNHIMRNDVNSLVKMIEFVQHYDPEKGFNLETYKKEAFSPSAKKISKNLQRNFWAEAGAQVQKGSRSEEEYDFVD